MYCGHPIFVGFFGWQVASDVFESAPCVMYFLSFVLFFSTEKNKQFSIQTKPNAKGNIAEQKSFWNSRGESDVSNVGV